MSEHEEFDRERMRREEAAYFACKESPPKDFKDVGAAVIQKALQKIDQQSGKIPSPF